MKIFEDYLIEKELLTESVDIPSELKKYGVTAKIIANALSKTPNPKHIDLQSLEIVKYDSAKGYYIDSRPESASKNKNEIEFIILEPKRGKKPLVEKYNVIQFFININGVRYIIKNDKLFVLQAGRNSKLDNIITYNKPKWGSIPTMYYSGSNYFSSVERRNKIIGKHESDIDMIKTADIMKVKSCYKLTYKWSSNDIKDIIEGWKTNTKTAGILRKIKLISDKYIQNPEDESKHKEYYEKRKVMWKLIQQFIDENFTKNDSEIYRNQDVALSEYLWGKFGGLKAFGSLSSSPGNIISVISWAGNIGEGIYSKKQRKEADNAYIQSVQSFIQSGGNITFGT